MGILILLSVSDRDVRIETGYKMQAYFTDLTSGKILDQYGMEAFKENRFADGLVAVQAATISEIEKNVPVDWETQTKSNGNLNVNLWPVFGWIFGFLLLCVAGFGIVKLSGKIKTKKNKKISDALAKRDREWKEKLNFKQEEYDSKQIELESEIYNQNKVIEEFKNVKLSLEELVSDYEKKFKRIKILHPNIESEIEKQIEDEYKQSALKWDESVKSKVELNPHENNIESFKEVIESYNKLPYEEKKFVKTDIDIVKQKYSKSIELKDVAIVGAVGAVVLACCNKFKNGNHSNYNEISQAYNKYKNLSKSQKDIFPNKDIITSFSNLYKSASLDNDNYNIAKKVEKELKEVLENVGNYADRHDISKLEEAKQSYEELSSSQTKYVDRSLYEKVLKKLREAQEDEEDYKRKKRREEEQRRMRISSSSSHRSSSSSFGSFRGHGGRSGGGGASRHF